MNFRTDLTNSRRGKKNEDKVVELEQFRDAKIARQRTEVGECQE
jgi:hypothetical protein